MSYKSDIWDINHKFTKYVTGTDYLDVAKYHNLPLNIKNKLILEIGVGTGNAVKSLSKTNKVIASDISIEPLKNLNCYKTCLSKNIKNLEPVDLAFSHLTFQHCTETEVLRILNEVNLKKEGIFSFQFACLNLSKTKLSPIIMKDINEAMVYFYSPSKMKSLIDLTNKKLIEEKGPIWFGDPFNFDWYIFKVKNK